MPCSGHAIFIPLNISLADAMKHLAFIQNNDFVDKKTKSFMIEWFLYNNNFNYFTSMKFVVEFTRGGGKISTWEIDNFRLRPFRDPSNYVYFIFAMLAPIFLFISLFVFFLDVSLQ